ncbi:YqhG family protein [Paenibacillus marinisediminis]
MNTEQVTSFVMRYLEATGCHIIEKTPVYVTVKLSEQADRALTNRPYYWGFVDRTGAEAETMRFTFVFEPAAMPVERGPVSYVTSPAAAPPMPPQAVQAAQTTDQESPVQDAPPDSILHRYFGVAPAFTGGGGGIGRIPREDVNYGSRRLDQLMQAAREHGRFHMLFDQQASTGSPESAARGTRLSKAYEPWLLINLKLEFACDLKREEIHSFGISCVSGRVLERFMERLTHRELTPKLPPHVHTMTWRYSIEQLVDIVEQAVRIQIEPYDIDWAIDASERLEDEMARLASYYEPLLEQEQEQGQGQEQKKPAPASTGKRTQAINNEPTSTEDEPEAVKPSQLTLREQYEMRQKEIRWQFEPRIVVQLINSAIVHLPFGDEMLTT